MQIFGKPVQPGYFYGILGKHLDLCFKVIHCHYFFEIWYKIVRGTNSAETKEKWSILLQLSLTDPLSLVRHLRHRLEHVRHDLGVALQLLPPTALNIYTIIYIQYLYSTFSRLHENCCSIQQHETQWRSNA